MVVAIFANAALVTLFIESKTRTVFFDALGFFACAIHKVVLIFLNFCFFTFFYGFYMIVLPFLF